jgi:hypothetical protein
MGHEQTSTTLDIYTHTPNDYEQRVTDALNGSVAYLLPFSAPEPHGQVDEEDADDL